MKLSNIDVVLVEPVYPGNVGAAARSASNFGIDRIKIVGNLDILCLEAKKMALYGFPLLEKAQRFATLKEAIADCQLAMGTVHQDRFNRSVPKPIWDTMESCQEQLVSNRIAVVFGREDNGLTREEVDLCQILTTIPTPENMSFNLAHSVSVFLYEIYRQIHSREILLDPKLPAHGQIEDVMQLLHKTLSAVGFFRGDHEISTMIQVRELVYRSGLFARDLPMCKAMLYKVLSFAKRAVPHMPPEKIKDCVIEMSDE